jgi:hypothetical protein
VGRPDLWQLFVLDITHRLELTGERYESSLTSWFMLIQKYIACVLSSVTSIDIQCLKNMRDVQKNSSHDINDYFSVYLHNNNI